MLLILGLGLATLIAALYVALNFWVISLLIKHAAAIRSWARLKLEAATAYTHLMLLPLSQIFLLYVVFFSALYFGYRLQGETKTTWIAVWWYLSVLCCVLSALFSIPNKLWKIIKERQSRLSYFVAISIAAITWLSTGVASNELNSMFAVPATMLPFALTAYAFVISTFFATLLIILPILLLTIFHIIGLVLDAFEFRKNPAFIRRIAIYIATYAQVIFLVWFGSIAPGYAGPVVARLALEFDFDDKVLCKNLSDEGKYLFLDGNKNLVLRVVPAPEWNMTLLEIAKAQKHEKSLSAIKEKYVVKCELLS